MKVLLIFLALTTSLMATEQAFPPSPVGAAELKTLPAGVLLKSSGKGSYFDGANGLFRPLFNYISKHDIAMTTPVEASIGEAAMFFWVAESERSKVAGNGPGVEVIEIPERRVASLGARGSYSARNFRDTRDELLAWLAKRTDVAASGEPYAVYWNGPFTPGFLKRYEVHIQVRAVSR